MLAQIPDNVRSGQYFITVWSDTYDAILEDTLASNINLDDATQIDNNNYKARPVSVLGTTPPDLVVTQATAQPTATAAGAYSFGYTGAEPGRRLQRQLGRSRLGRDNADLAKATVKWQLGEYQQQRSLGNNETYSVAQTVQLGPSVSGLYLVVESDWLGQVAELDETNNAKAAATVVDNRPADLQVTSVVTQPQNFSARRRRSPGR
jgi:hypothetical protein